jgi:hypothetical protein
MEQLIFNRLRRMEFDARWIKEVRDDDGRRVIRLTDEAAGAIIGQVQAAMTLDHEHDRCPGCGRCTTCGNGDYRVNRAY